MASPKVNAWKVATPPLHIEHLNFAGLLPSPYPKLSSTATPDRGATPLLPPLPPKSKERPANRNLDLSHQTFSLNEAQPGMPHPVLDRTLSSNSVRSRPTLGRNMSSNSVRSRPLMTDFSEYRLHPVRSEGSLRIRDLGSPPRRSEYAAQVANPVPTPHNSIIEVDQVPTRGSSLRFSETPSSITVVAGEQTLDKQEFQVDETLIRSNSGFFNRGFSRREFLNDEKPETIKLPKTSAKVFQVYLGWINARQISLPTPLGPLRYSQMAMPEISEIFDLLIDCYEAGKKLQDNDFKDVILDTVIQMAVSTRVYPINCIRRIYDMTDPGSAFRCLIVDMAVHANVPEWWGVKENRVCVTEEALWDIVGAVKAKGCEEGEGLPAFIENSCVYHHHRFFKRSCYKEKIAAEVHPLYRGLSGRTARD